jgi:hypothetical protein
MDGAWWYGRGIVGVGGMAAAAAAKKDKKKIFQDLSSIVAKILKSLPLKGEKAGDRGPSPLFSEFPPFPTPGPPDRQTDRQSDERYFPPKQLPTPCTMHASWPLQQQRTLNNTFDIGGGQIH